MRNLITMIFLLSLVNLQGCTSEPNCRVFVKGQIRLSGSFLPNKPSDVYYSRVKIEDMNGLRDLPEIFIEFPRERVLLSQLSPKLLFAQFPECKKNDKNADILYSPTECHRLYSTSDKAIYEKRGYEINPILFDAYTVQVNIKERPAYNFVFTSEKILTIDFFWEGVLWDYNQIRQYHFPISYGQAVELFGEPDRVYNIHEARL